MRPKSTATDLPPRLLRHTKTLKSSKVWAGYYDGRNPDDTQVETALGGDLPEAKRKWAELECVPAPAGTMAAVFDRYAKDALLTKAPRTQGENLLALKNLRPMFDSTSLEAITPLHLAQYHDKRTAKVSANHEMNLLNQVWNMAREWGYTDRENAAHGVRKNTEHGRDFYADESVWQVVQTHAHLELKATMQQAYLTGQQRTTDVLKMRLNDIDDITAASKLLSHAGERITADMYRQAGEKVNPTR